MKPFTYLPAPSPATAEIRAALEETLTEHLGRSCRLSRLERRASNYRTSYPLEEVDVLLDDGTELRLMFKDVSRQRLTPEARQAKPPFVHDTAREIETYRTILKPTRLGTAICYGAVLDPQAERCWLFLEKMEGVELYQVGDFNLWGDAARWLASLHGRFQGDAALPALARKAHLLVYTRDYYRTWMRRALDFERIATGSLRGGDCSSLERLGANYERVVERLTGLPGTMIHGEFYASNVLVGVTEVGPRVCPVDWEMAAVGPGLIDVAALTAGKWNEEQKTALALEYHAARLEAGDSMQAAPEFLEDLAYARLHLAVQWLGWSPSWSPPAEHAQDWMQEALHLADKLKL